ncbi:uncharacterized protein DC041_0001108 [Schistosoma bovis]|uniref:Uncharacterized protein n=1 Tax=Schistosoma bovis TaxID=6184 RepID=A0A430PZY6_SCHBO|nr:uncharacterized protein DC041_0010050 [Schistosoma bovis]RTG80944.1 uncharacterized protein DC041_0001100 [Schistosoma bovis]RTG80946.1 uncharacterized protein DC041_0001108 [Schistosoma bovis]
METMTARSTVLMTSPSSTTTGVAFGRFTLCCITSSAVHIFSYIHSHEMCYCAVSVGCLIDLFIYLVADRPLN